MDSESANQFKIKTTGSCLRDALNSFARFYNFTSFYFDIVLRINNANGKLRIFKPPGATYIIYLLDNNCKKFITLSFWFEP